MDSKTCVGLKAIIKAAKKTSTFTFSGANAFTGEPWRKVLIMWMRCSIALVAAIVVFSRRRMTRSSKLYQTMEDISKVHAWRRKQNAHDIKFFKSNQRKHTSWTWHTRLKHQPQAPETLRQASWSASWRISNSMPSGDAKQPWR